LTAVLKVLATATFGVGWDQTAAAGMGDHELARINRRNVLDPDGALWVLARTSFGRTSRP
jgi:hypothetical protein